MEYFNCLCMSLEMVEDLVRKGEYYNACLRYQSMYGSTFAEACNAIVEKYFNKTGKKAGKED